MSETVSHHDKSRAAVGKTAFAVAAARGIESRKPDHIIYDEFSVKIWDSFRDFHEEFHKLLPGAKLDMMVDGMAVRTKFIDDEIMKGLQEIDQVVVIGAGLDFRPWRMHHYLSTEAEKAQFKSKKWFEVDFQEMFDYKLKEIGDAVPDFEYHAIVGNACVDNWEQALIDKGFDPSKKSMWLLEGFTGYLTEEELRKVFSSLSGICHPGSKMISTWIGPNCKNITDMHRFKTEKPIEFISQWNWGGEQWQFMELMEKLGRNQDGWDDYLFAVAYFGGAGKV